MENHELTDTLVITKKFRSSNEFCLYIDEIVQKQKLTYMDAVINYCKEVDIDIGSIGPLINAKLKEKIRLEAEQANMMKPTGRLPV